MCAIIDNNVRHEVFGAKDVQTGAGRLFFDRVNVGKVKLVVGGKLRDELSEYSNFKQWLQQALIAGLAREFPNLAVNAETERLLSQNICKSNGAHVLALARVSGARLLFTNDQALQSDFGNPQIISGIRGRIYTTLVSQDVSKTHRNLISRTDLCNL